VDKDFGYSRIASRWLERLEMGKWEKREQSIDICEI
jgi:hypothetical protein